MRIQIIEKLTHPIGGNPMMQFRIRSWSVNGTFVALRQGGMTLWAFPARPKFTREEEHEFDLLMNRAWEEKEGETHD